MFGKLEKLQPIGRALMLPIAVLPIAGILLRLGQPDLLDIAFVAAAGRAIFDNLGLLFALGIAVGLARENHGAAGLAGLVCYLVATEGAKALWTVPPEIAAGVAADAWKATKIGRLSVPVGLVSGLISGWLYNRYSGLKAPAFLAFFEGRRFVPIAAGGAGLVLAALLGLGVDYIEHALDTLSRGVATSGPLGLFVYGVLNRLLLVTGLHHILNNIAWFIVGDYQGATGDLNRFFAGDPDAGAFMSGFFPTMMFGLPAACFAMYRAARPERRAGVAGMFLSLALTSLITGVTEPIEFTFLFVAPILYVIHAVLTGLSMVIMNLLDVHLGFGFSAGLIDYVLNFGLATRPFLLLPVGATYALIYYFVFSYAIRRFDLPTPGRDRVAAREAPAPGSAADRGADFVEALGGAANLATINACTTRLRLTMVDLAKIDEERLRQLGALGILKPGGAGLQVILGPIADTVAGEIRDAVRSGGGRAARSTGEATAPTRHESDDLGPLLPLLGGRDNVGAVARRGDRLIVDLKDEAGVQRDALAQAVRAIVEPRPNVLHLLVHPRTI